MQYKQSLLFLLFPNEKGIILVKVSEKVSILILLI